MTVSKRLKGSSALVAVLIAALTFASCSAIGDLLGTNSASTPVNGVSLNKTSTSIFVGGSETLSATLTPVGATNRTVTWTSSDTAVATVSAGMVTGVSAGTATITVTTQDGGYSAACSVAVAVPDIEIAGTWLDNDFGTTLLTITNTSYSVDDTTSYNWDYTCEIVKYSNDGFNAGDSGAGDCGYAVVKFTVHPNSPSSVGKYTVLRWKSLVNVSGSTTVYTCEGYGTYFDTAAEAEAGANSAGGYFSWYSQSTKQ
ncbi:MAG: Ig-like domain-containing protein [Treponemataceae bacterium]